MTSERTEGRMLPFNIQFFADGGADGGEANNAGNDGGENNPQQAAVNAAEAKGQTSTTLSSEEIQKMIQKTVDTRTADLGKTIADLKKENAQLKKANMTAEEIQKAEREEFEAQKAEVELQKRQIYAHKAVAAAGYGDNAEAVVDIVLGATDEQTDERLQNFKSLVDKLVSETVQETFKANGRVPNGSNKGGEEQKQDNSFVADLGKKAAETAKQSDDILKHYYGG